MTESRPQPGPSLADDLKELYGAAPPVPPALDDAIIEGARRHETAPPSGRRRLRLGGAAAAAAVLLGVAMFVQSYWRGDPSLDREPEGRVAADIDGSGRVDILDAFRLQLLLESGGSPEGRHDVDGDGRFTTEDVQLVAARAVELR